MALPPILSACLHDYLLIHVVALLDQVEIHPAHLLDPVHELPRPVVLRAVLDHPQEQVPALLMLLELQLVEAFQLKLILDVHLSQEASDSLSLGRFKLEALLSGGSPLIFGGFSWGLGKVRVRAPEIRRVTAL